tara:strand:+ start:311 stop:484 length:174 start_codon:yes stop_codon:yes gene_type:complete
MKKLSDALTLKFFIFLEWKAFIGFIIGMILWYCARAIDTILSHKNYVILKNRLLKLK